MKQAPQNTSKYQISVKSVKGFGSYEHLEFRPMHWLKYMLWRHNYVIVVASHAFCYHCVEYIKFVSCAKFHDNRSKNNKVMAPHNWQFKKSPCQIGLILYTTLRNLKERPDVWFVDYEEADLSSIPGGQFYLGNRMNKIEHEGIGTCGRIEISQDADNTDQKVKWCLKVRKIYKLL